MAHGPRASRRARPRVSCAAMLQLTALLLVAQIQLPPPRGYVNDFAAALDSASVAHMEAVIAEVRAKTRGEIAVVTLPDIADRPAADVALEIGRRWGVGAKGEAGDPAKNLGVVVLLVPLKNHRPGTGQIFVDRKSTRLNSSHGYISYAVFCLKKKKLQFEWADPLTVRLRTYLHRATEH